MTGSIIIRDAKPEEFVAIGSLMASVYQRLEGFPDAQEQPNYYRLLKNVGAFVEKPKTRLLVALHHDQIAGAVVYFGDMQHYGSGGSASKETNASGFRLLAVDPQHGGKGIGKQLVETCIDFAKKSNHDQVIIHSTEAMFVARRMYEKIGFERSSELDFRLEDLPIFGFRLKLS